MTAGALKTRRRQHIDNSKTTPKSPVSAVFDTLRQHRPEEIPEAAFLFFGILQLIKSNLARAIFLVPL